jgi:xanthosine utilization system XapX-like protein
MSIVATVIVLGLVVLALVKSKLVRPFGALVCVVFGVVLAASPAGPAVSDVLGQVGSWASQQLQSV